jgi:hypothetical protein
MKIRGKVIQGPNVEIIAIPRSDAEDIIFKAEAVRDYSEFDALCPEPKPPMVKNAKEGDTLDVKDPTFIKQLDRYAENKIAWMILKSLSATPDLEWETVKWNDKTTWRNYRQELADAGFSLYEIRRIENGVMIANGMSESRMEEARKRFLASQQAPQVESSSQKEEQNSTQSGGPVSG